MEEFNNSRKETMLFLIITLVLLLIGVLLRIAGLQTRNLEYDEIWTFAHYVKLPFGEMFSDLATPNNHPLNSLVIKYFKLLDLPQLLQIRLGVFLAGILLLIVTGLGLRRLTRSLPGICCGVLLLALNIPLIRYSQTARGYEFQALFTVCVMFSLLFFEMDLKQPLRRILWAALFLIAGIATCVSVTSGVIFVTALAFSYGVLFTDWRNWRDPGKWMEKKELWIAFLLFAGFVLLWYGLNYSTLAKGQSFGNTVTSPGKFLAFAWHTIAELPLTLTIPLSLAGTVLLKEPFQRRIAVMGLLSTLLVLLSALVFKAGDSRVYIPLIPILAVSSVLLFNWLNTPERRRLVLPVFGVLLVLTGIQFKLRYADMNPPDMGGVFATAAQTVPPEALTIYSPTDSLIISTLFTEEFQFDKNRRIKASPISLLLINSATMGIYQEWTGGTADFPVTMEPISRGEIAGEASYSEYLLRPLRNGESLKNRFLIVLLDEPTVEQLQRFRTFFGDRLQIANYNFIAKKEIPTSSRILIYYSPEQSVAQMLALQSENGSAIRFLVMEGKEAIPGK